MAIVIKPKKLIFSIALVIGILGVGYLAFSAHGSVQVPELFNVTRERAASVSRDIVELTSVTEEKIARMHDADQAGDRSKGIVLVREARRNNASAYTRAFDLSEQLKILAQTIAGISSARSQRIASEAIATELALVSEFIGYTQDLNIFLDRLQSHFVTGTEDVQAFDSVLKKINSRILKINTLNQEFLVQMRAFDRSL